MDCYSSHDSAGAASAVRNLYFAFKDSYEIEIICGNKVGDNNKIPVKVIPAQDVYRYLIDNSIDLIHYFKATGRHYFANVISYLQKDDLKKISIITTVCQKPSFFGLELSPKEIINSKTIVFIDKAAYNDKFYDFIDLSHKKIIYFGHSKEHIDLINSIYNNKLKNTKTNNVIFGRGSSLNKCHKKFIKTFERIKEEKKSLIFVGGKYLPKWIEKAISSHSNTIWIPALSYDKWLEKCSSFDVFLYQLPTNAYSSIDGTLGDAMLLGIPPILYGPEAIKERIHHVENGYIANSLEEIVHYANILASNKELRKVMGDNARNSTLKEFSLDNTIGEYKLLYENLGKNNCCTTKIPVYFYLFYYMRILALIPRYLKSRFYV